MSLRKTFRAVWDNPGPDQGWAWVIMVAIWMTFFIIMSPIRSSGVFYNAMMLSMDATHEQASWPFSLCNAVSGFSGIIGGYLNERYSCRQVNILSALLATLSFVLCYSLPLNIFWITASYGILFGIAHGICLPILQMVQNQYFELYRTSATGVSLTGVSAVGVMGPLMATYCIERYDMRGCFLILASLVCQMFVFSSLMRPRTVKSFKFHEFPTEAIDKPKSGVTAKSNLLENEFKSLTITTNAQPKIQIRTFLNIVFPSTMTDLLKKPVFIVMCFTSSTIHVTYFTFLSFAIAHGCSTGLNLSTSTMLVSVYSVGEFASRFAIGFMVDQKVCSANVAFSVVSTLAGVSIMVFGVTTNVVVSFVSVFAFGLAAGAYIPLRGTLLATLFGVKATSFGIGIIHTTCGFLFLLMPKLIGLLTLNKEERTFESVCYVLGGACIVGGIAWSLQIIATKKKQIQTIATKKIKVQINTENI